MLCNFSCMKYCNKIKLKYLNQKQVSDSLHACTCAELDHIIKSDLIILEFGESMKGIVNVVYMDGALSMHFHYLPVGKLILQCIIESTSFIMSAVIEPSNMQYTKECGCKSETSFSCDYASGCMY